MRQDRIRTEALSYEMRLKTFFWKMKWNQISVKWKLLILFWLMLKLRWD